MNESGTRGYERNPTDRSRSIVESVHRNTLHTVAITEEDLYQALSNRRRRQVIRALEDGPRELGPIARAIAAVENGIQVDAVDTQQRKRVYVSLYQAHLDKMDRWGIVEWDETGHVVAPGPAHEAALNAIKRVDDTQPEPASLLDRAKSFLRGDA